MGAAVLSLTSRDSVSVLVRWIFLTSLFVDVRWNLNLLFFGVFLFMHQDCLFSRIEVVLSSHAIQTLCIHLSSSTCNRSLAISASSSGWPSPVDCLLLVQIVTWPSELIEVVKHEIHVLLLILLQVMDDSLILVHFNSDVCISLATYGAWLHEIDRLVLI